MANRWGNDAHGPGGDPSWLGGTDRHDGAAAGADDGRGPDGWSADFSSDVSQGSGPAADSDFQGRNEVQDAESMAPRFGDTAAPDDRDRDSTWASSFDAESDDGRGVGRRGGSFIGQLVPILVSVGGLALFAVVFVRMGFDMWWILLIVGVPLISRVVRLVQRNLRR